MMYEKTYNLFTNFKDLHFSMPGGWNDKYIGIFVVACKLYIDDLKKPTYDENFKWRRIALYGAKISRNQSLFTINSCMEVAQCIRSFIESNYSRMLHNHIFNFFYDDVVDLLDFFPPDPKAHRRKQFFCEKRIDTNKEIKNEICLEEIVYNIVTKHIESIKNKKTSCWTDLSRGINEQHGIACNVKQFLKCKKERAITEAMKEEDLFQRNNVFCQVAGRLMTVFDYIEPTSVKKSFFLHTDDKTSSIAENECLLNEAGPSLVEGRRGKQKRGRLKKSQTRNEINVYSNTANSTKDHSISSSNNNKSLAIGSPRQITIRKATQKEQFTSANSSQLILNKELLKSEVLVTTPGVTINNDCVSDSSNHLQGVKSKRLITSIISESRGLNTFSEVDPGNFDEENVNEAFQPADLPFSGDKFNIGGYTVHEDNYSKNQPNQCGRTKDNRTKKSTQTKVLSSDIDIPGSHKWGEHIARKRWHKKTETHVFPQTSLNRDTSPLATRSLEKDFSAEHISPVENVHNESSSLLSIQQPNKIAMCASELSEQTDIKSGSKCSISKIHESLGKLKTDSPREEMGAFKMKKNTDNKSMMSPPCRETILNFSETPVKPMKTEFRTDHDVSLSEIGSTQPDLVISSVERAHLYKENSAAATPDLKICFEGPKYVSSKMHDLPQSQVLDLSLISKSPETGCNDVINSICTKKKEEINRLDTNFKGNSLLKKEKRAEQSHIHVNNHDTYSDSINEPDSNCNNILTSTANVNIKSCTEYSETQFIEGHSSDEREIKLSTQSVLYNPEKLMVLATVAANEIAQSFSHTRSVNDNLVSDLSNDEISSKKEYFPLLYSNEACGYIPESSLKCTASQRLNAPDIEQVISSNIEDANSSHVKSKSPSNQSTEEFNSPHSDPLQKVSVQGTLTKYQRKKIIACNGEYIIEKRNLFPNLKKSKSLSDLLKAEHLHPSNSDLVDEPNPYKCRIKPNSEISLENLNVLDIHTDKDTKEKFMSGCPHQALDLSPTSNFIQIQQNDETGIKKQESNLIILGSYDELRDIESNIDVKSSQSCQIIPVQHYFTINSTAEDEKSSSPAIESLNDPQQGVSSYSTNSPESLKQIISEGVRSQQELAQIKLKAPNTLPIKKRGRPPTRNKFKTELDQTEAGISFSNGQPLDSVGLEKNPLQICSSKTCEHSFNSQEKLSDPGAPHVILQRPEQPFDFSSALPLPVNIQLGQNTEACTYFDSTSYSQFNREVSSDKTPSKISRSWLDKLGVKLPVSEIIHSEERNETNENTRALLSSSFVEETTERKKLPKLEAPPHSEGLKETSHLNSSVYISDQPLETLSECGKLPFNHEIEPCYLENKDRLIPKELIKHVTAPKKKRGRPPTKNRKEVLLKARSQIEMKSDIKSSSNRKKRCFSSLKRGSTKKANVQAEIDVTEIGNEFPNTSLASPVPGLTEFPQGSNYKETSFRDNDNNPTESQIQKQIKVRDVLLVKKRRGRPPSNYNKQLFNVLPKGQPCNNTFFKSTRKISSKNSLVNENNQVSNRRKSSSERENSSAIELKSSTISLRKQPDIFPRSNTTKRKYGVESEKRNSRSKYSLRKRCEDNDLHSARNSVGNPDTCDFKNPNQKTKRSKISATRIPADSISVASNEASNNTNPRKETKSSQISVTKKPTVCTRKDINCKNRRCKSSDSPTTNVVPASCSKVSPDPGPSSSTLNENTNLKAKGSPPTCQAISIKLPFKDQFLNDLQHFSDFHSNILKEFVQAFPPDFFDVYK